MQKKFLLLDSNVIKSLKRPLRYAFCLPFTAFLATVSPGHTQGAGWLECALSFAASALWAPLLSGRPDTAPCAGWIQLWHTFIINMPWCTHGFLSGSLLICDPWRREILSYFMYVQGRSLPYDWQRLKVFSERTHKAFCYCWVGEKKPKYFLKVYRAIQMMLEDQQDTGIVCGWRWSLWL